MKDYLKEIQRRMIGLEVSRITFDFQTHFMFFHHQNPSLLKITTSFTLQTYQGETVVYWPRQHRQTEAIVALFLQTITQVEIDSTVGRLDLTFSNGTTLSVAADGKKEAWEFHSNPDGLEELRIVCLQEGQVAVWKRVS